MGAERKKKGEQEGEGQGREAHGEDEALQQEGQEDHEGQEEGPGRGGWRRGNVIFLSPPPISPRFLQVNFCKKSRSFPLFLVSYGDLLRALTSSPSFCSAHFCALPNLTNCCMKN